MEFGFWLIKMRDLGFSGLGSGHTLGGVRVFGLLKLRSEDCLEFGLDEVKWQT